MATMALRRATGLAALIGATLAVMLLAGSGQAAESQRALEPTSKIRLLNAAPGVGTGELSADGDTVGEAGFAKSTGFTKVEPGPVELKVEAPGGVVLEGSETLEPGAAYTVTAGTAKGQASELSVFPDGTSQPGVARLRVILAAPELGRPNVQVGRRVIARKARYKRATRYWTFAPGRYRISIEDPETGRPVVAPRKVGLAAGTTSTAVVLGSRGERARVVLIDDATAAPAGAPGAGLGGLAPQSADTWLPLLLLAFGIAMLGTGAARATSGRFR